MKTKGNTRTRFKRLTVDKDGKERGTSEVKQAERQSRKIMGSTK